MIRFPLDGFLWNLILGEFLKIVEKILGLIKVWTSNYVNRWHVTEFFLEWEIFQIKVVEEIKTHFMLSNFFCKSCHLWENGEKCGRAVQATDDSIMWCICVACQVSKARIMTHHNIWYLLIFCRYCGYVNVPHCCVRSTLPILSQ
jgi:hypothetical protein